MSTKDDEQRREDETASTDESRSSTKKVGTLLGLGDDAVKASSVIAESANAAALESGGEGEDEDEETKVRRPPDSVKGSGESAAAEGGDARKFKGTMMGLGDGARPEKTDAPEKPKSTPPPAAEGGDGKKLSGTMLGLGDSDKKDVERTESKKATSSDLGSKTLVMGTSQPSKEKRATPKKTTEAREDFKGKTLPLATDAPAKTAAPKSSRSSEGAADKAAAQKTDLAPATPSKASSGMGVWLGLAGVAALAAFWLLGRPSDEATPTAAEATTTVPANEPEPAAAVAEPVVSPVEPAAVAPSAAPVAPSAAPDVPAKPALALAPAPRAPKPVREPPPAVQPKAESSASDDSGSLSPALAARVAVGKSSVPAARCRQRSDPAGTAEAFVTFASSGQVSDVRVLDPYAATPTGACIEGRLKQVTMNAFSGDNVTVRVPIQLY